MEKVLFESAFVESLNKNFDKHSKYFDFDLYVLSELGTIIFEVNKCLILGFHRASITLTNHLLERLLKIALMHQEAGIGAIPIGKWNETYAQVNEKKYDSFKLGNTIEKCMAEGLITPKEKDILFDVIRNQVRNGFSHAEAGKILESLPDDATFYHGNFSNRAEVKAVQLNPKIIPVFQALQIESFAKEFASVYFDSIFNLIKNIDERLKEKEPKT